MKKRKYVKSGKCSKKEKHNDRAAAEYIKSLADAYGVDVICDQEQVSTYIKDDYAIQLIQAGFKDAGIWLIRNGKQ